jgi:2-methylcitrate dehydratase PrpD
LALALRDAVGGADIVTIDVHSYRDAVRICDKPEPRTPVEAKFSLQHAAAVCLLRGQPGLDDFDVPATQDSTVAQLRAKVRLHEDDALTAVYPAHFGAAMRIALRDGRQLQAQVTDALGDPEIPLSLAQLHGKAHMLLGATAHTREHIETLIADCAALVDAPSVGAVARWMR